MNTQTDNSNIVVQEFTAKKHITESEMVNKDGSWKDAAKNIAYDADEVLNKFIETHKGEISLCCLQSILNCSLDHQIRLARLNSIEF